MLSLIFFFQAEDGIRDAQESRGLGDVYKRQIPKGYRAGAISFPFIDIKGNVRAVQIKQFDEQNPVSYTHLTLPTIYSV